MYSKIFKIVCLSLIMSFNSFADKAPITEMEKLNQCLNTYEEFYKDFMASYITENDIELAFQSLNKSARSKNCLNNKKRNDLDKIFNCVDQYKNFNFNDGRNKNDGLSIETEISTKIELRKKLSDQAEIHFFNVVAFPKIGWLKNQKGVLYSKARILNYCENNYQIEKEIKEHLKCTKDISNFFSKVSPNSGLNKGMINAQIRTFIEVINVNKVKNVSRSERAIPSPFIFEICKDPVFRNSLEGFSADSTIKCVKHKKNTPQLRNGTLLREGFFPNKDLLEQYTGILRTGPLPKKNIELSFINEVGMNMYHFYPNLHTVTQVRNLIFADSCTNDKYFNLNGKEVKLKHYYANKSFRECLVKLETSTPISEREGICASFSNIIAPKYGPYAITREEEKVFNGQKPKEVFPYMPSAPYPIKEYSTEDALPE